MVKELKNTEHKLNESAQSSCISSSEIDRSHFSKLKKPKERVDQKKKNQRKGKKKQISLETIVTLHPFIYLK